MSDINLLDIAGASVTAPAGCGKTYQIAEALKRHTGDKPILILTHTNAGVVALRGRLTRAGVHPSAYRLSTIDGWAIRLISTYPMRSGHDTALLELATPKTDYPNIRIAASSLLKSGHINDVLAASYAQLIVDEYQDCSIRQHVLIVSAASTLPTCILGDPLQGIFGFGSDRQVKWREEVSTCFPLANELDTPWRWINAGAKHLGEWLLEVRGKLLRGEPIDLREAPDNVTWIQVDGSKQDHQKRLRAARTRPPGGSGCTLIIGDSMNAGSRYQIASQTPGAVTVEAVDLRDFVSFAQGFNPSEPNALEQLARFAQGLMTGVGAADLLQRVQILRRGTARKQPSVVEQTALDFLDNPTYCAAANLLVEMNKEGGVRVFRRTVLRCCIEALRQCDGAECPSFPEAAIRMREQFRFSGRKLPRRAVGSTLLLKGLEAEVAVILDAEALDARNLYVAMTRGSKALIICSSTPILNPHK